ncbi:MAG TPA: bifunctional phosphoglucose/phosphomannose isomerase [Bacteroidetes bacterium]|nr:bifunctional phosphoglucose/phosphomannose isomerase [Bacteroidota bacterium]
MSILNLDYKPNFVRFDREELYQQIISFPQQIEETYFQHQRNEIADFYKSITNVIICGMGGSAIAGDLISTLYGDEFPIVVRKDYKVPTYCNENTLGIVCSYSGNTEETVSCFEQLEKQKVQIVLITSSGRLKYFAKQGYLYKFIPTGFQPRAALGHLFFAILRMLEDVKLIPNQEVIVKITHLNVSNKLKMMAYDVEEKNNTAKQIAQRIVKKIPLIYASNPKFSAVAYRWKCQFNENAKHPAFSHTIPEMNHNEIEAWESPDMNENLLPIFLCDFDEEENYKKRVSVLKDLFTKNHFNFLEVSTDGKQLMSKLFSTILLGDMITYYLAILNRVDPSAIKYIDYLKANI